MTHYTEKYNSFIDSNICPCCGSIRKDSNVINESFTCNCAEQKKLMVSYIRSNIPYEFWDKNINNFTGKETYKGEVTDYCNAIDKYYKHSVGMFLWGKNGTGKTLFSICVLKYALAKKYKCFFAAYSELISMFTNTWKSDSAKLSFEKNIESSDFLVIDDLGKEYRAQNNLVESILDTVIRYRKCPVIITSNKNAEDLRELYGGTFGESLSSLIYGKMIHIQLISKTDFRKDISSKLKEIVQNEQYRSLK